MTLDLSERFMLYANFLTAKEIGSDPAVIARFPEIASRWGILDESVYDYASIAPNAHRFSQDAAQGLKDDPNAETVDKAIANTADASRERSEILERAEFLGKLPKGPYPVTIPLQAKLAPGAVVPEIAYEGKFYSCFSADAANVPADRKLAVTPRELAHTCLGLDPKRYFACTTDLAADVKRAAEGLTGDDCTQYRTGMERLGAIQAKRHSEWLNLTMRLVDRGQAVMAGVTTPEEGKALALWFGRQLKRGGGHAVLVVGYVTHAELTNPAEQRRGMLGDGVFDRLAAKLDPEFAAKVAAGALPSDPAGLRDARVASVLGKAVAAEGGILLFRNSWGAKVSDVEIGADGFQAMTFDFFLKSAMLVQSRMNEHVAGVAWDADAGPAYCPATTLDTTDPWLARDHSADVAKFLASTFPSPPNCAATQE